jgi:hypothetical protein
MNDLLEAAIRYSAAGVSTVPLNGKKPTKKWSARQKDMPAETTLRADYGSHTTPKPGVTGIGGVCGEVSGRLLMFEFEAVAVAELGTEFSGRIEDVAPGLYGRIEAGWSQNSPRGGVHVLMRVDGTGPLDGNTILAARYPTDLEIETAAMLGNPRPGKVTLIETRAEGGYFGMAPGHTTDGREWAIRHGGAETVETVTEAELATLFDVARSFDEIPASAVQSGPTVRPEKDAVGTRPGDAFEVQVTWEDVLVNRRETGRRAALVGESDGIGYWVRPGKDPKDGQSATTNGTGLDRLIVFSSNWPPFNSEQHTDRGGKLRRTSYSKFEAEALIAHGGDWSKCAAQLAEEGFGVDELSNLRPDIPDASTPAEALEACIGVFQGWFKYPDPGPIRVVAAIVNAGEQRDDPPIGLFLVGPSSSGKTETVKALNRYPDVRMVSSIASEGALLSGTSMKERTGDATGGILNDIGEYGIIVIKDFTTIVSMNRDARATILAAIREIQDGSWSRDVGTDGGRTLSWSGHVTFIAAVTPEVDKHRHSIGAMGERFMTYRMPTPDPTEQALMALSDDRAGATPRMEAEIRSAFTQVLDLASVQPTPEVSESTKRFIADLSVWGVMMRTPVWRDPLAKYEIGEVPEPEQPPRLAIGLQQLYRGLLRVGATEIEAEADILKVVRDSVPPDRIILIDLLLDRKAPMVTSEVGKAVGMPTNTVTRRLDELAALGIVDRGGDQNHGYNWRVSQWAQRFPAFGGTP